MNFAILINREIQKIVSGEIKYQMPEISEREIQQLISTLRLSDDLTNIKEVRKRIRKNSALAGINDLNSCINWTIAMIKNTYKSEEYVAISQKLEEDPGSRLLIYLSIVYHVALIPEEEIDFELPFLLNDCLEHYPFLIEMDDFLDNCFYRRFNEDKIRAYPKLLLPVLEKGMEKYTGKKVLLYWLALCYLYIGNREFAFHIFNHIHISLIKYYSDYMTIEEDAFTFYEYTSLLLRILKDLETLPDNEKIIETVSKVLRVYFEQLKKNQEEEYIYRDIFIELFLIRMRANIHLDRIQDVKSDYYMIKPYMERAEEKFWIPGYDDVMNALTALVKTH